jgi:hypothetical protein
VPMIAEAFDEYLTGWVDWASDEFVKYAFSDGSGCYALGLIENPHMIPVSGVNGFLEWTKGRHPDVVVCTAISVREREELATAILDKLMRAMV